MNVPEDYQKLVIWFKLCIKSVLKLAVWDVEIKEGVLNELDVFVVHMNGEEIYEDKINLDDSVNQAL